MSVADVPPRHDPQHYTLDRIPDEFEAFAAPVRPLAVGSPGKVGLLELAFAPLAGATRLVHHYQQTPLQIFRPIYLDPQRPDMAFVHLIQVGGGILQGDRYRVDVHCQAGAAVHITTQAATKIYRMERDYATQLIDITADADSVVEYLPDPIIPFRDSRFCQRTQFTVAPTATVIYGETLLPGRVAYGEQDAYAIFVSDTEVTDTDGSLLFVDQIKFAPGQHSIHTLGRLGPSTTLATLYVVTRQLPPAALVTTLRAALAREQEVWAGASVLPHDSGVSVRILGPSSPTVQAALRTAWNAARQAVLGVPAPNLRKG